MASGSPTLSKRGTHVVFFLVLAGHGLLLSQQVITVHGHSALQGALLAVLFPLQRGAEAVVRGVHTTWSEYADLRGVRGEKERLREKIGRLEQTLWLERDIIASHERLLSVLQLEEELPYESIVARVIGLDSSAWYRTVTLDRGTDHGGKLNAPVIGGGGLVGRVIAVGAGVAQVQLLSDRDCSVGALLVRSRSRGIVSGLGTRALEMKYVSNLDDVIVGDIVVTSGIEGMYPKGIAMGRVTSVSNGARVFKVITLERE